MAVIFRGFIWISLVFWILCLETHGQSCDQLDLLALKLFAGNLTEGSIILTWNETSNCCQWEGVLCQGTNGGSSSGRVIELILKNKGLNGTLSQALGQLDQLKMLDLSHNNLMGVLPSELSKLEQLSYLDLSNNRFSGTVAEAFSGLKHVHSLNVSCNQLEGTLDDFSLFPDIAIFNISNNSFSGPITSRICQSSQIQIIDISMNQLWGGLENLYNCTSSLKQLHAEMNTLSGHVPAFMYFASSLEELSMSGNNFSGPFSDDLSKLSKLKVLSISGNHFAGPFPDVLGHLSQLEELSASSNKFSGSLPATLSKCSSLQVVDFRNNSFTGPINIDFTGLPSLHNLDLASNHLNGTLPSSLSSCQDLRVLSFARNELTGELPSTFGELASLSFLSLSNNSFVNLSSSLATLQHCENLATLILTKNFRGEDIPKNIGNFTGFSRLIILALGNCGLGGQIPEWLLNCRKLQVLDLSWNRLDGSIPPWIGQMDKLFYLDISNNSLTGELPKNITQLQSLINWNGSSLDPSASAGIPLFVKRNQSANGLQYNHASNFPPSILLSDNTISGTLWPEIGNLKQLYVLDLSRNKITGTIPDSISKIANLEILDLSFNDLHGSIPMSLAKLTFLSRFNVAYNQLEGQVPSSGQFLSISNSSYEGNPRLCGGPVLASCETKNLAPKPVNSSPSKRKLDTKTILGVSVGVGVCIALLLAAMVKLLCRRPKCPIEYLVEEGSRTFEFSEGKLDLFQNSCCKNLTISDLLKATDNFNQSNIIGCGGFGLVYKASLSDGSKVAIKRLSGDCGQMEREFQAEVEALSRAQHKNLVSLQGYCQLGNDRLLIYSFMENGSLDYWLHEGIDGSSILGWSARLKIAQGAAHGLAYLHKECEPKIVHRDIKSSNILLDDNFEAHLADFGLCRFLRPCDTHVTTDLVGTLGYIPPEYSQALVATFRGDIYSFGVVLLELVTGRRPVEICKGKNCRDLVSWVLQMKLEKKEVLVIDTSIWNKDHEKQILEVLDIACKCLNQDPRQRPSIDHVVLWIDAVGVVQT